MTGYKEKLIAAVDSMGSGYKSQHKPFLKAQEEIFSTQATRRSSPKSTHRTLPKTLTFTVCS